MKKTKRFLAAISLTLIFVFSAGCINGEKQEPGIDTIKFCVCWDGLQSIKPPDEYDNVVGNVVKSKAQVRLKMEWTQGNDADNVNRKFALGKNMPDIMMAPYWGGADASSAHIRAAARDGLLLPWDDYISQEKTPYLMNAFSQSISSDFMQYEMAAKEFGGKKYILPMHTPKTVGDTQNWGYTVYCRKDILESLGVEASDITSSADVKALARRIKDGNFKDINNNPIIPASCWQNGWSYETYLNSFRTRGFTAIDRQTDGTLIWEAMGEDIVEEVKFMQDFISSGLFDPTAFRQTTTQALQKHRVGGVGLTSSHYIYINDMLKNTLYKEHPEMRYVPLGPILDAKGEAAMPMTVRDDGEYGFAVLVMTADCKNPEAVVRYLNYINSPEGQLLAYLGIENTDWSYIDIDGEQKPKMTDAYFAAESADGGYSYSRGIDSIYTLGVSRVPWNDIYEARRSEEDDYYSIVKDMYPLQIKTGTRAGSFDLEYNDIEVFRNRLKGLDYGSLVEAAYVASSQADAVAKIRKYQQDLNKDNVLTNYLDWLQTKLSGRTDILF